MSVDQIRAFVQSPYYKLSDAKMLFFFTHMTLPTAGVMSALLVLSLLFKNFWCRYLCPYGALLGGIAWFSPSRIQRSEPDCTRCGQCDRACPSLLPVSRKETIRSPECTGCLDCVHACPAEGALSFKTAGARRWFWSPVKVGAFIVLLFACVYCSANVTGHWRSSMTGREFRARLETIDSPEYTHPAVRF